MAIKVLAAERVQFQMGRWVRCDGLFSEFCSRLMPGFVSNLNAMMENSYSDSFFAILLGQSMDELWKEYKYVPQ
ncbi:hypothetical protein NL676_016159 [Syzygium grande]|nr:hypothetical protein NL676_016159 [Syzygium grande]